MRPSIYARIHDALQLSPMTVRELSKALSTHPHTVREATKLLMDLGDISQFGLKKGSDGRPARILKVASV